MRTDAALNNALPPSTPDSHLTKLTLPTIATQLARVHITQGEGNFVVESRGGRFDDLLSSHLGLIHPVMDQIKEQLRMNLPEKDSLTIEQALMTSSELRLPFWFQQKFPIVLRELVVNAVESSWKTEKKTVAINLTLTLHEGRLCIEIADNGIGIDPQNKARLFQEGWSTKEGRLSPCGNGLYYSQRFINEIMQGSMEIFDNSEIGFKGTGALVRIQVPVDLKT